MSFVGRILLLRIYYKREYCIIWLSLFTTLLIQCIPWSSYIYDFQPNWIFLVLVYWIIKVPNHVNIGTSFIVGYILDLFSGDTFGIHSLAMSIIAYLLTLKHQLIYSLTLWQRTLIVVLLSIILDYVIFLIKFFLTGVSFSSKIFWIGIVNGITWPWLSLLMNKIYIKFSKKYFF